MLYASVPRKPDPERRLGVLPPVTHMRTRMPPRSPAKASELAQSNEQISTLSRECLLFKVRGPTLPDSWRAAAVYTSFE